MASTPNFWQRIGIQDWFLTNESTEKAKAKALTPDTVYSYIVEKFERLDQRPFLCRPGGFYHEFIISFNADDYKEFVADKQGIFGLIVQETVSQILRDPERIPRRR
jgi:hypothetical protein